MAVLSAFDRFPVKKSAGSVLVSKFITDLESFLGVPGINYPALSLVCLSPAI